MNPDLGKRAIALGGGFLLALSLGLTSQACLTTRDEAKTDVTKSQCTACHGDNKRDGTDLDKAAPPSDLSGHTDPSARGVGAHQNHLNDTPTHAKLTCNECHKVPESVDSPGHADSPYPAEVTFDFAGLASLKKFTPSYDPDTHTCAKTYCHRDANPTFNAPRTSDEACGTCHGLPPASVVNGEGPIRPHPQSTECSKCHDNLEQAGGKWAFKDPSLHVNGVINVGNMACNTCHGGASGKPCAPPSELAGCAPPVDLAGDKDRSALGVGAHQQHLEGGVNSRPVLCSECHVVPASVEDPTHLDDTTPNQAELTFSGVATTEGANPVWDRNAQTCAGTWCHGPVDLAASLSPKWTRSDAEGHLGCTDCHSFPPPAPHPQMANCFKCHTQTIDQTFTIIDRTKHVDGTPEEAMQTDCTWCHGGAAGNANPIAPPVDLEGNTETTARGVGAHQAHLTAKSWRRSIECNDCHKLPTTVWDEGHFDTDRPAELTFSTVAVGQDGTPSWDGTTCANVWCHGATPTVQGGKDDWHTPTWTSPPSAVECGSCHGFPPPTHAGYGNTSLCGQCHSATIMPDTLGFKDPTLHINGTINFDQ